MQCPNCGSLALTFIGQQWWPIVVIRRRGWQSFCYIGDEFDSFQRGAIRLYRCKCCEDSFLEPSCIFLT